MFKALNIPALTEKARLLSNTKGSTFVTDDEVKSLLQDAFDQLFNHLVKTQQNYYLKESPAIIPVNKSEIMFPDDMYKLRSVQRVELSLPIYEKTLNEVAHWNNTGFNWSYYTHHHYSQYVGFVMFPDRLKIYPESAAEGERFKLFYVRDPKTVESETMQDSWERYLGYKTAFLITIIEDNPRASLREEANTVADEIKELASQRDTGPKTITELDTLGNHAVF